ncbi:MAG: BON domain-containing protein [Bryobacteraceae bacterium]
MRVGKLSCFLAAAALSGASFAYASGPTVPKTLDEKVLHALNMLPYYDVFDDISYHVDGDNVTLAGEVWQPVLKLQAESAIKQIDGVGKVDDQIEVLPLSNIDDQIRFQTVRAIYGYPALSRYVLDSHPTIHIIVKNGNVTLTGVVATEMDRELAGVRANLVHNVFSVTNELRVQP